MFWEFVSYLLFLSASFTTSAAPTSLWPNAAPSIEPPVVVQPTPGEAITASNHQLACKAVRPNLYAPSGRRPGCNHNETLVSDVA